MQRRGKSAPFDRNDGTHPIYRDGLIADCFSNPLRRGGEGGDGAGLAAPFDAERVGRAAGVVEPWANEGRLSARGIAQSMNEPAIG